MKADPEGVTRTTQWGAPLEQGGEFDWPAIARSLGALVAPERLMAELEALADRLKGLDQRLACPNGSSLGRPWASAISNNDSSAGD